jgi:hypothetical protein
MVMEIRLNFVAKAVHHCKPWRELHVVFETEVRNVCDDVIRTVGPVAFEARLFQHAQQEIPPPLIFVLQVVVIFAW